MSLPFNVVLVEPEIPPNTGSIARLCGATNSVLHLIRPLGFSTDDKHLRRAGLDYWKHVNIVYWDNLEEFLCSCPQANFHLLSKKVTRSYIDVKYNEGDYLIFGKETKGLPNDLLTRYAQQCCTIPMENPHIRSLNLAMAAGIVLYEAIRQQF